MSLGNVAQWPTATMAAFCAIDNERACCSTLHWPQATNLLPADNNMTIVSVEKRVQQHNAAYEGTILKMKQQYDGSVEHHYCGQTSTTTATSATLSKIKSTINNSNSKNQEINR